MQSFQLSYTVVARCVFVSLMWVVICCMLQYFCCDVWRLRALFNSSGECCCVCHSGQWSSWVQGMCSQQPVIGGVSLPLLFSKYLWCCLYQTYWGAKKWPLGAPSPAYTSFTVLVICICRIQNSGVRISGPYLIQSQVLFELPPAGCCFFWGLTQMKREFTRTRATVGKGAGLEDLSRLRPRIQAQYIFTTLLPVSYF